LLCKKLSLTLIFQDFIQIPKFAPSEMKHNEKINQRLKDGTRIKRLISIARNTDPISQKRFQARIKYLAEEYHKKYQENKKNIMLRGINEKQN